MEFSRITSKGQMTVPKRVRLAAGLAEGDVVMFDVDGGRVSFRKVGATPGDSEDQTVLEEWESPEDDHAWRDL
jgi:AbrB family looped-hinge helix DNA binding protein